MLSDLLTTKLIIPPWRTIPSTTFMWSSLLVASGWFVLCTPLTSINKTDHDDITEILTSYGESPNLTINLTQKQKDSILVHGQLNTYSTRLKRQNIIVYFLNICGESENPQWEHEPTTRARTHNKSTNPQQGLEPAINEKGGENRTDIFCG